MLDHLLQWVINCLAEVHSITLATYGPAGLQAGMFPCEARGRHSYLLVPRPSDHLLNREDQPGRALLTTAGAGWSELAELCPIRLQLVHPHGWGFSETIDVK